MNKPNTLRHQKGSYKFNFIRAIYLENSNSIQEKHETITKPKTDSNNETKDNIDMDTNLHFVCFVEINGDLFELDGRRKFPKNRGKIQKSILHDSVEQIKKYLNLDEDQSNYFSICALSLISE